MKDDRPNRPSPRRRFCRQGLYLLGAGAALPLLSACSGSPESEAPLRTRVPRALIPASGRATAMHGELPVEIIRQREGYLVRSLLCTHQGCRVEWQPDSSTYLCPCHEGRFDEHGEPIQGPPRRPLRILPAEVDGPDLVIGGSPAPEEEA